MHLRCEVEQPYSLGTCGHCYCTDCIMGLLSSATRNNDFPAYCCASDCSSTICLPDMTHLLPAAELTAAYKGAFRAFVQTNHNSWGCCPTADCPQVGYPCFNAYLVEGRCHTVHRVCTLCKGYMFSGRARRSSTVPGCMMSYPRCTVAQNMSASCCTLAEVVCFCVLTRCTARTKLCFSVTAVCPPGALCVWSQLTLDRHVSSELTT